MLYLHKHLTGPPRLETRMLNSGLGPLATVEVDGTVTITSTDPDHLDAVATAFMAAAVDLRAYQASPDKPEPSLAAGAAVALG